MIRAEYPDLSIIGIGSLGAEAVLPLIDKVGNKVKAGLIYSSMDSLSALLEKTGLSNGALRKAAVKTLEKEKVSSIWPLAYDMAGRKGFFNELKKAGLHKSKVAVVIAPAYDGLSSGIACRLLEVLSQSGARALLLAIMPPGSEPEVHMFNSYCALASALGGGADAVILVDRGRLEVFEVVDAYGKPFKGLQALGVMLQIFQRFLSDVEWFAHSAKELDIRHYTPLLSLSNSLEIYGSIKNMLRVAAANKLMEAELESVQCLFVYPTLLGLLGNITHDSFMKAVSAWLENKAKLSIIHVAEPRYVRLGFDKIDLLLLAGGFRLGNAINYLLDGYLRFKQVAVERKLVEREKLAELEEKFNSYLERFS